MGVRAEVLSGFTDPLVGCLRDRRQSRCLMLKDVADVAWRPETSMAVSPANDSTSVAKQSK